MFVAVPDGIFNRIFDGEFFRLNVGLDDGISIGRLVGSLVGCKDGVVEALNDCVIVGL